MQLLAYSAPYPHPAIAFDGLARSAFQSSNSLAFLTVVVQSDSQLFGYPKLLPNKGARSRRRASERIQAQKTAVNKSLSWLLNRLAWVELTGSSGPWVCTVESSSLDKQYSSFCSFAHKQGHPDLYHLHAVLDITKSISVHGTVRASMLKLESLLGVFGDALCIPAGSDAKSLERLAWYVTKSDPVADALVAEVMQGCLTDDAPSRFFASASLQNLTSAPWTRVVTTSFPYGSAPRTTRSSNPVSKIG